MFSTEYIQCDQITGLIIIRYIVFIGYLVQRSISVVDWSQNVSTSRRDPEGNDVRY